MVPLLLCLSLAATNLCLPAVGATVTASSTLGGYPVSACTDGLRSRDCGYWNDATQRQFPDWVAATWDAPRTIRLVRATLPLMPYHPENQRRLGQVQAEWRDAEGQWQKLAPTNEPPNPLADWTAPRTLDEDQPATWQCEPVQATGVRLVFLRGQADGWSFLDELEAYEVSTPEPLPLKPELLSQPEPTGQVLWQVGQFDGHAGGLDIPQPIVKDDGTYQNGGYWATPLAWFMVTVMGRDPELAARTFCEAVEDFREHNDVNEWVNERATRPFGVNNYNASATMPLAGARRLRERLQRTKQNLPAELQQRFDEAEAWLKVRAKEIVRGSSRVGKDGVRIFTPDATGGYGAFWVRDWSYSLEGCPESCTIDEVVDGYRFLAAAQRADGCMPDRVGADGVGVYSPGGERNPLSANGSVDQAPFMVIVCHQVWQLGGGLEPFQQTADQLERALKFMPRNPQTNLVTITDAKLFRPYSFLDTVPLVGDEQFSSVLYWDACAKLAELYEAVCRADKAIEWRLEAERVKAGLQTLWSDDLGLFVAASKHWRQPSIWGSLFAVYAGVTTPEQTRRITDYMTQHTTEFLHRAQLRHLPRGTYWGQPEVQYVSDRRRLLERLQPGLKYTVGQDGNFPSEQPADVPPVTVRFDLDHAGPARLVVGLRWSEEYRAAPLGLRVMVNGQAGEVDLPNAGRPELKLRETWPRAAAFAIPDGVLKPGANELTLTVLGHRWWHYDGLWLEAGAE